MRRRWGGRGGDPAHVVDLALEPVGAGPDAREAVDFCAFHLVVADAGLHANAVGTRGRVEVEHQLHAREALG